MVSECLESSALTFQPANWSQCFLVSDHERTLTRWQDLWGSCVHVALEHQYKHLCVHVALEQQYKHLCFQYLDLFFRSFNRISHWLQKQIWDSSKWVLLFHFGLSFAITIHSIGPNFYKKRSCSRLMDIRTTSRAQRRPRLWQYVAVDDARSVQTMKEMRGGDTMGKIIVEIKTVSTASELLMKIIVLWVEELNAKTVLAIVQQVAMKRAFLNSSISSSEWILFVLCSSKHQMLLSPTKYADQN